MIFLGESVGSWVYQSGVRKKCRVEMITGVSVCRDGIHASETRELQNPTVLKLSPRSSLFYLLEVEAE